MKKALIVAALAAALSTVAYLLLQDDPAPPAALAALEKPSAPVETSESSELPPSQQSVVEPATPVAWSSPSAIPELPPPQLLSNPSVGHAREIRTTDFNRYLVFMGLGAYVEQNDPQLLKLTQQQYGLTDDELRAVVDYSVTALRSDRNFQKSGGRSVCERRSAYQSLHDFGMALNQLSRDTKSNQERLGREAEAALGVELFGKINNHVLREPPQEITVADFPALFAARNSSLEAEADRFCNSRALQD